MSSRNHTRRSVYGLILCAALAATNPLPAVAQEAHQFYVSDADPARAIQEFGTQSGIQILASAEQLEGKSLNGVSGKLTTEAGLNTLLAGTGLVHQYVGDRTVALVKEDAAHNIPDDKRGAAAATTPQKETSSFWDRFRLAQADATATDMSAKHPADGAGSGVRLEEIVVTAQKREERLQDVPVPVTAIDAGTLVSTNQLRIQDYYTRVPGLSVTTSDTGAPQLTIRGLTTGGYTNPTVGVMVDDVPFGSSSRLGYGELMPDIDPSELSRIEVLRGPQGTLYGSNSIGGLFKFVTLDPSTERVSGHLQGGFSQVENGAQLGYNLRGSVNVPVSDTWAVRASAFTRIDPGYVDDPRLGADGVNKTQVSGGRLSALWRPSQDFSLKLGVLIQHAKLDGSPLVELQPGLGELQQRDVRDSGWYDKKIQAYSAIITAKIGAAELTALSGYSTNTFSDSYDFTDALGALTRDGIPAAGFNGFGVAGTPDVEHGKTSKFSQELRLHLPIGPRVDWLLGAFYNHEDTPHTQDLLAADELTGVTVGSWLHEIDPSTLSEYAAFTDLTFHITDRFDVQVGGRESENRQSYAQTFIGPYAPLFLGVPSPALYPQAHSKENAFTYLVTPQFRVSPDLMVYARLASGFRSGGPNTFSAYQDTQFGLPSKYSPDKTRNYEIGVKGDALDHSLSFDASLYSIDWQDIQLFFFDPGSAVAFTANGRSARSQGVELSVESRPMRGLTIGAWVVWNDAELTSALPQQSTGFGLSGDRLPNSSRFSGSLALDEEFILTGNVTGFVGGALSYVGDREGVFLGGPQPRQVFPAYAKTDLRAGVKYESWAANFFVNNVADRRGILAGGLGSNNPIAFNYIQPRTVGLSFSRSF